MSEVSLKAVSLYSPCRYIVRVKDHIATVSEVSLKAVSLYSPCRYKYIVRVKDHIATVSEVSLNAVSLYSPCRYIVLEPFMGLTIAVFVKKSYKKILVNQYAQKLWNSKEMLLFGIKQTMTKKNLK